MNTGGPYRGLSIGTVFETAANVAIGVLIRECARRLEENQSPENIKTAASVLRQAADLLEGKDKLIQQQKDWITKLMKEGRKRR